MPYIRYGTDYVTCDGMPDIGREAAPGWDAIDGALEAIFGSQEPVHWEISSAADVVLDEFRTSNPLLITDPSRAGLNE